MNDNYDRPYWTSKRFWYSTGLLVLLFLLLFLYFYYFYPGRNLGPRQPIPFSHRVHAGVKEINCRFCHPFVERSMNAGIPSMEKCFFCHQYIIPLHPEIEKERAHFESKDPVRWVQVFWVPDFVQFRHQPHIRWAELDCEQCHGPVQAMDRLAPRVFTMQFCITCHREMGAQVDCWLACHH